MPYAALASDQGTPDSERRAASQPRAEPASGEPRELPESSQRAASGEPRERAPTEQASSRGSEGASGERGGSERQTEGASGERSEQARRCLLWGAFWAGQTVVKLSGENEPHAAEKVLPRFPAVKAGLAKSPRFLQNLKGGSRASEAQRQGGLWVRTATSSATSVVWSTRAVWTSGRS